MLFRYVAAGGLLLAAAPVLGAVLPGAPPVLDLAAHFLVPSLLLSALLSVTGLLVRQARITAAASILLAMGAFVLLPHALPAGRQGGWGDAVAVMPDRVPALKVYFHNIWSNNRRSEDLVAASVASGADVVVMAETTSWRKRFFGPLASEYPHGIACTARDECDLTLFSRLPLADRMVFHDRISGARGIAATLGDVSTGQVRIVGVHLGRPIPPDGQSRQFLQVQALLRSDLFRPDLPTLLVGDFNAVPWGQVVQSLARGLRLQPAGGIEGSWPDFLPMPLRIRIDQALLSPGIAVTSQSLGPAHGSDHRSLSISIGPSH